MQDSLDLLLKESLKQQLKRKQTRQDLKRLEEIEQEVHKAYNNPDNWIFTKVIALHHIDEKGSITPLGTFKEYKYKYNPARKLCRGENLTSVCTEYVKGDYWIHLPEPELLPNSTDSADIIRQYLSTRIQPVKHYVAPISVEALLKELNGL